MNIPLLFREKDSQQPAQTDEARVLSLALYMLACIAEGRTCRLSGMPAGLADQFFHQAVCAVAMEFWPRSGGQAFDAVLAVAAKQGLELIQKPAVIFAVPTKGVH